MAIVNYANTDFGVVVETVGHLKSLCRNDVDANFSIKNMQEAANELGWGGFTDYVLQVQNTAFIEEMIKGPSLDFLLEVLSLPEDSNTKKARQELNYYYKNLEDMLENGRPEDGIRGLANVPYGLKDKNINEGTAFKLAEEACELRQYFPMQQLYRALDGQKQKDFIDRLYNRGLLRELGFDYGEPLFRDLKNKDNAFTGRYLKANIDWGAKRYLAEANNWPDVLYSAAKYFFSDPEVYIGVENSEDPQFFFKEEDCFGKICDKLRIEQLDNLYSFINERYDMYQRKMLAYEALETISHIRGRRGLRKIESSLPS